TRSETVMGALRELVPGPNDWALVHDAARPGLPAGALSRLIDTCFAHGAGGLLALPVADTLKRAAGREQVDCVLTGASSGEEGLVRSEEHTSELQSRENLVCRLLLEKKKN